MRNTRKWAEDGVKKMGTEESPERPGCNRSLHELRSPPRMRTSLWPAGTHPATDCVLEPRKPSVQRSERSTALQEQTEPTERKTHLISAFSVSSCKDAFLF